MLKNDSDLLRKLIKEKRYEDLLESKGINPHVNVRVALIEMHQNLFQSKAALRTNADGTVTSQAILDYSVSLPDVLETLKKNRRSLGL